MTDPGKARELARKLGYIPQDQRPEVIVSARTPQARLDELVAAGYQPVLDEKLSRALGELPPEVPKITRDPETGARSTPAPSNHKPHPPRSAH